MRYYISDLHFCHDGINKMMDHRGFNSSEEMNEYMIKQWNSGVRKNDEVVILGDFCISKDPKTVEEILKRLNGKKYLIIGNHDKYIYNKNFDRSLFQWIEMYKEMNDNKRKVILSHYPIICYNGQYSYDENNNPKTYMLYGHVHNTFDEYIVNESINSAKSYRRILKNISDMKNIPCQMINCFCRFSNYIPLTLDEWIKLDEERRSKITINDYNAEKI